jgi:hypothetical protein
VPYHDILAASRGRPLADGTTYLDISFNGRPGTMVLAASVVVLPAVLLAIATIATHRRAHVDITAK